MATIVAFALAFISVYAGTSVFRRWSLGRGVVDVPNERSSHVTPTPRGGGVVFVIVCLIGYAGLVLCTASLPWSYLIGAILVASISWLDDLRSISFAWRLGVHFLAGGLLVFRSPALWNIDSGVDIVKPVAAVLWIVWMVNAYNFMDGIDGIASLQAVVAGVCWLILAALTGQPATSTYAGMVAFSVLGFMIHNWQPAKVFMGDVGSAFLGYTLASIPFLSPDVPDAEVYFAASILFVWFFVFDTVITLVRRLVRREKVWQAHRSHLYQRIVIAGRSHASVTTMYGAFAAVVSAVYIALILTANSSNEYLWRLSLLITVIVLSSILIILSARKAAE